MIINKSNKTIEQIKKECICPNCKELRQKLLNDDNKTFSFYCDNLKCSLYGDEQNK